MNEKFDELAKGLAQSTTRRGALKKFGVGLAGMVLAALGLVKQAEARPTFPCDCGVLFYGCRPRHRRCIGFCAYYCNF